LHGGNSENSFDLKPISSTSTAADCNNENFDNNITYTWNDVNVYYSVKNDRILDRLMFRTRKSVAQKHILKDGKIRKKLKLACFILR